MPEKRKKGKHLTWEERNEIQRGLRERRTFTEIAMAIGCSPDTISKEIRKHRYHKPVTVSQRFYQNRCKYRDSCRKRNICGKKRSRKCRIPCRQCNACNERCPEFADPDLFEYDVDGNRRMKLFYCDPRRSEQKGQIEKNHEYIRYVLPSGTSFHELTQEKVDLLMNHVNSTARPSLQGVMPARLALQHFGNDTAEKLGIRVIDADDICLKPELLK